MPEQYAKTTAGVRAPSHEAASCEGYLSTLFGRAPESTHIELRYRTQAGMGRAFYPVSDSATAAVEVARHAAQTDVYVGVLPRARQASRRSDLVASGGVLWVDCDTPESARALAAFEPAPSLVMASGTGTNRHAYWLLNEPTSIDTIEAANRRLAVLLGADPCCADANRVLRPPSRNHKTRPPADVLLLRCDPDERYGLDDVVGDIWSAPAPPAWPIRDRTRIASDFIDPLLSIEPAEYIELLTGIHVPSHGKIACPFHEDRTPSLHVYPTAARGWYCYGCGRGGSIYDFAADLWLTGEPRGRAFVELRRRLRAAAQVNGENAP